jgi:hypothetical protein
MIDAATFATADAAIAAAHRRLLADCEIACRDAGADEAQIIRVREMFATLLREGRETAIAMLECHATTPS